MNTAENIKTETARADSQQQMGMRRTLTPRTDAASVPLAKWTQTPVCGSFARQLEMENRELRFLIKNPNQSASARLNDELCEPPIAPSVPLRGSQQ